MSQTLDRLADRLDIIEVCTRLHWCVDHRDWSGLDELLDEHVSFPTPDELARPGFDAANFVRPRSEITSAYPVLLGGLITQHLIAGHQVEVDGDRAVCRAHSINVHVPEGDQGPIVLHGNEYRFDLRRTDSGWRIVARQTWIRWRSGDETHYAVDARMQAWATAINPESPVVAAINARVDQRLCGV
jgi:hypothetical protein